MFLGLSVASALLSAFPNPSGVTIYTDVSPGCWHAADACYVVTFEPEKTGLNRHAANILDKAMSAYQSKGRARIVLSSPGAVDNHTFNIGLAHQRLGRVGMYLASKGIVAADVEVEQFGEDPNLGARLPKAGQVEIVYGVGAGG